MKSMKYISEYKDQRQVKFVFRYGDISKGFKTKEEAIEFRDSIVPTIESVYFKVKKIRAKKSKKVSKYRLITIFTPNISSCSNTQVDSGVYFTLEAIEKAKEHILTLDVRSGSDFLTFINTLKSETDHLLGVTKIQMLDGNWNYGYAFWYSGLNFNNGYFTLEECLTAREDHKLKLLRKNNVF